MRVRSRTLSLLLASVCLRPALLWGGEPEVASEEPPPAALLPAAEARSVETKPRPLQPLVSLRAHRGGSGSLTLELEVLAPIRGQAVRIQPSIDGRPVPEARISAGRSLGLADQYTLTLPSRGRDFVLTVVVQAGGAASAPLLIPIHEAVVDTRPVLRALLIGVGRYGDAEIARLRYPGKDARDLGATLVGQRRRIYREVQTRELTEEQASREQILEAIKWLEATTGARDTALLFLAGHGTNDPDGTYYFLPHDARSDKRTMISGAELQLALRGIRGRVVLLLDTCHSGNVLGRRSLTRLLNELMTESRVVVLAASTGDQTSLESAIWQNGAFTKALIEGLRGAADYAEDGQILLSELETWIGVRVRDLTRGAQTPTLAKPNAVPDYVMAALPAKGIVRNPQTVRRQRIIVGTAVGALGIVVLVGVLGAQPWQRAEPIDLHFK